MFGLFGSGVGGHFEATYRAFPVAFIDKPQVEDGDKVILPPSALDRLASLHIEYPMLFKIENRATGRSTHCGVLEFVAEEGQVFMPHWMMQNLLLQVGDLVKFRNVSLPKGTYVKLQPVTSDFLDISNPKAVLERALRSYSCLTAGDCFVVNYNNRKYEIEVKETKPDAAISVIETDCQVDFEAPKDYKEPEPTVAPIRPAEPPAESGVATTSAEEDSGGPQFVAFTGSGRRLDGKTPSSSSTSRPSSSQDNARTAAAPKPAPQTSKPGTFVGRGTGNRLLDKLQQGGEAATKPPAPASAEETEDNKTKFKAFAGKAYSLSG